MERRSMRHRTEPSTASPDDHPALQFAEKLRTCAMANRPRSDQWIRLPWPKRSLVPL